MVMSTCSRQSAGEGETKRETPRKKDGALTEREIKTDTQRYIRIYIYRHIER